MRKTASPSFSFSSSSFRAIRCHSERSEESSFAKGMFFLATLGYGHFESLNERFENTSKTSATASMTNRSIRNNKIIRTTKTMVVVALMKKEGCQMAALFSLC